MAKKEKGYDDAVEEAPEVKPVKVTGPINLKGQSYDEGDEVMLTEEEAAHLTEIGAPIEGVEPKTAEEMQAAHDEGRTAFLAEYESRAKADAEKSARDEAYEDGEEFDEGKFNEDYDRGKKVANPDYEPPAAKEA
jgi:hypothetical protein